MVRIFTRVKTDCCGFLFGVLGIVSLINGDHFCLFQNTIFEFNSGVLVRIFDNQRVTKNANRVLIRIKILHHFFALMPFGHPERLFLCLYLRLNCKDLSLFRQNGEFEKAAFRRAEIRQNPQNSPFGDFRGHGNLPSCKCLIYKENTLKSHLTFLFLQ